MRAVLPGLLRLKCRGAVRQVASGFWRPRRLLAHAGLLAFLGLLMLPQLVGDGGPAVALQQDALVVLLGAILVMAVAVGVSQRGPVFPAADLDFLFPAPLCARDLLLYRLCHLYPRTLFGMLVFFGVFAVRVERPAQLLPALLLFQITIVHLQLSLSLWMSRLDERLVQRMGSVLRIAALVVLIVVAAALVPAFVEGGGLRGLVREIQAMPVMRLLLLPAVLAAGTATAPAGLALAGYLAAQLVLAGLTLWLVVAWRGDFSEASLVTSRRSHRAAAEGPDAESRAPARRRRTASRRARSALFHGAGCIVYKNLIALSRSLRSLLAGLAFTALVLSPMLFYSHRASQQFPAALAVVLIPLLVSVHLNFDFRREGEQLLELRALPLAPSAVVFAELVIPVLVALIVQVLFVSALAWFRPAQGAGILPLTLFLPLTTVVAILLDNVAFFLFPPPPAGSGRSLLGGGPMLLKWIVCAAALMPAVLVYARTGHWPEPVRLAAAWLTLAVEAGLLFGLLVRLFRGRDQLVDV